MRSRAEEVRLRALMRSKQLLVGQDVLALIDFGPDVPGPPVKKDKVSKRQQGILKITCHISSAGSHVRSYSSCILTRISAVDLRAPKLLVLFRAQH